MPPSLFSRPKMGARTNTDPPRSARLHPWPIEHIDHDASKRRPYEKDYSRQMSPDLILGRQHIFRLDRPLPPLPAGSRVSADLLAIEKPRQRPNLSVNTQVGPNRPRPRALSDPVSAVDNGVFELPGSFAPGKAEKFFAENRPRGRHARKPAGLGLGLGLSTHTRHESYSNIISRELDLTFTEKTRKPSTASEESACRLTAPFTSMPEVDFINLDDDESDHELEQKQPVELPTKSVKPLTLPLALPRAPYAGSDASSLSKSRSNQSLNADQRSIESRSPLPTPLSAFASNRNASRETVSTMNEDPFLYDEIRNRHGHDSTQLLSATSARWISPRMVQNQFAHISDLETKGYHKNPRDTFDDTASLTVYIDQAEFDASAQPMREETSMPEQLRFSPDDIMSPSSWNSPGRQSVFSRYSRYSRYSSAPSSLDPRDSYMRPPVPRLDYSDCVVYSPLTTLRQGSHVFDGAEKDYMDHHKDLETSPIESLHGTRLLERAETDLIRSILNEYFDEAPPESLMPGKVGQPDLYVDIDDMILNYNHSSSQPPQKGLGVSVPSNSNNNSFKPPNSPPSSPTSQSIFSSQAPASSNTSRQSSLKSSKLEEDEEAPDMQRFVDLVRRKTNRRSRRATISSPLITRRGSEDFDSCLNAGSRTQPPTRGNTPNFEADRRHNQNQLEATSSKFSSQPSLIRRLESAANSSIDKSEDHVPFTFDNPDPRIRRWEAYVAATNISATDLRKENDALKADNVRRRLANKHLNYTVQQMNELEARVETLEEQKDSLSSAMAFNISDQVRAAVQKSQKQPIATGNDVSKAYDSLDAKNEALETENTALVNLVAKLARGLSEETTRNAALELENERLRAAMSAILEGQRHKESPQLMADAFPMPPRMRGSQDDGVMVDVSPDRSAKSSIAK